MSAFFQIAHHVHRPYKHQLPSMRTVGGPLEAATSLTRTVHCSPCDKMAMWMFVDVAAYSWNPHKNAPQNTQNREF